MPKGVAVRVRLLVPLLKSDKAAVSHRLTAAFFRIENTIIKIGNVDKSLTARH
ncbi:hypothetical protein MED121_05358 [Marinomonas sp. MED121]|nr:hypothetical protein MED121_05358 [Marinomonas sp. MED121]